MAGHQMGAKNLRSVLKVCRKLGIETVTVYAFSTENWKRPKEEVDKLMELVSDYVDEVGEKKEEAAVHVRFVGDLGVFDADLQTRMAQLERDTAHYSTVLNIAFNYGGRQEIVNAANLAILEGKHPLTMEDITAHLYTHPSPDPDLVVRTGGEYRISNFLLWQSAYTEYAFTATLWPDLGEKEIAKIVKDFLHRHRRFGGL